MTVSAKAFIVGLVASVTFTLGAAPAVATTPIEDFSPAAVVPTTTTASQTLSTTDELAGASIDSVLEIEETPQVPHNFDVAATIALAESEIGTSRPTGWSQPGECIMSTQR